jgi:urease accessory protein
MIIQKKIGNIGSIDILEKNIDKVQLEWFETNKRILHKKTNAGMDVSLRFLKENQQLTEGDILFEDETKLIVVEIKACDVIVIKPASMQEMASLCYEIGNKHLPLFYFADELLTAFEKPLYNLLLSSGYDVKQGQRKLLHPLKTTVSPHGSSSETLFSKIMKLTSSE